MKIIKYLILIYTLNFLIFNNVVYAQSWVLAGSVPEAGLTPSISVVDANTAWIAGGSTNSPRVYRTTNGGNTWEVIPSTGTTTQLFCVWAINSDVAFVGEGVVNSYARLYKINPANKVWVNVLETGQNDGSFNNLIFSRLNPLVGGALADEIYITTNGGNSWVKRSTGVTGVSSAQNSLMLVDDTFFGFGLKNGASRVRMTTNGGNAWLTMNVNLVGSYTSGFTFKDDKLIGLSSTSTSMPFVSRTTNGGTTWNPVNIGEGLSGKTLIKWVPGTNVVYIIGENGAIKRSLDNGLTWSSMQTANVTGLNHFDFNKVNNIICGYAVSSNGSVIKLADSVLILTNTNSLSSEIPANFYLCQNYPNPFNPITNIKYKIAEDGFVTLKVYDFLGREIVQLVNEYQKAGEYKVSFSISKLSGEQMPSGTYFYKIETGSFTDVKRMVLIK